ncbi:MAG: response regulator receiver protein [Acidobacteriales bacterium]|nr:response regulator receiver protein [Terriglobales bacterium]
MTTPIVSKSLPKDQAAAVESILLVQTRVPEITSLHRALRDTGFEVVVASTVREALGLIVSDKFSALICNLHAPAPGDGFTLINAMRHAQPHAVTMILTDYPALKESLVALLPIADELVVTPVPLTEIIALLKDRLKTPRPKRLKVLQPVATILERNAKQTISDWLVRVNAVKDLVDQPLSDEGRTGHLPRLLQEVIKRLRTPRLDEGDAATSLAAISHGKVRREQGYTAAMLVTESRILQVCIFKMLRNNLGSLDWTMVLTDVMTIADEVDSQLAQTTASFSREKLKRKKRTAKPERDLLTAC